MNDFEKKYGVKEDKKIKASHRYRRMFAIRKGVLYIAESNTTKSHAEWFKKERWILTNDYSEMELITRGCVIESGIYFYRGWDFKFDSTDISVLLPKLPKIVGILNIPLERHLYAGMLKDFKGKIIPNQDLGRLENLI